MMSPAISIKACDCVTPFGRAQSTWAALQAQKRALAMTPVFPGDEEAVPLALASPLAEPEPERWLKHCVDLLKDTEGVPWGDARHPVIVTSSNFGIGQLLAYVMAGHKGPLNAANPERAVVQLAEACGWGPNRMIVSNACISALLGLRHASNMLKQGKADAVLVFTFDFLSPFVAGGFKSLKILNETFPQPYGDKETGAIGLGDGAAYAILTPAQPGEWQLGSAVGWNECFHMTGNDPTGAGFDRLFEGMSEAVEGRAVWIKGHGTGTLEAGRLESASAAKYFPEAPLVSWKGSLGHTLGSCGLVELAIARAAMEAGSVPGNSQSSDKNFTPQVARDAFPAESYAGAVLVSSAFGGAHAAQLLLRPEEVDAVDPVAPQTIRRYLHVVETIAPTDSLDEDTVRAYRKNFPGLSARRMSNLPLMLGQVTREAEILPTDEVVFASEYGGTQALEMFLESFPAASPIGFQNSTQPGPASLALVARKQSVTWFTAIVEAEAVTNGLRLAMLSECTVHLLGGEEHGGWLTRENLAFPQDLAFYLKISDQPEGAIGAITLVPSATADDSKAWTTAAFTTALTERRSFSLPTLGDDRIDITWL